MDEDSLNKLPINDLFDLLVKSVNELLELNKNQDQSNDEPFFSIRWWRSFDYR